MTDALTEGHAGIHMDIQTNREADGQTGSKRDKRIDRQTEVPKSFLFVTPEGLLLNIFESLLDTISTTSQRHLRSLDRRDLFVPWAGTIMVKPRSFTIIGPSLWNRLPPVSSNIILSSNYSTSLS